VSARRLDGREVAAAIRSGLKRAIEWRLPGAPRPDLAVVHVGDDAGAAAYRRNLERQWLAIGGEWRTVTWPADLPADEAAASLAALSQDRSVHGVLLQQPLPAHLASADLWQHLDPAKDPEGMHPRNLGRRWLGGDGPAPCTALAVLQLLGSYGIPLRGQHVVVIGRSPEVGKAIAQEMLRADATVTVCHSRTADLAHHTRQADILVTAVGHAGLIRPEMVRHGVVVVDVATVASPDGGLTGDVAPDVADRAAWLSPVPGGVGPVTVALLMAAVVRAAGLTIDDDL
jgi:methylenetetrahydrofolate dehydrogenase (NADP+)/methenyltetrahydrofolate cyclohydrolase